MGLGALTPIEELSIKVSVKKLESSAQFGASACTDVMPRNVEQPRKPQPNAYWVQDDADQCDRNGKNMSIRITLDGYVSTEPAGSSGAVCIKCVARERPESLLGDNGVDEEEEPQ